MPVVARYRRVKCQNGLTEVCAVLSLFVLKAQRCADAAWEWPEEGGTFTRNKKGVRMCVLGVRP